LEGGISITLIRVKLFWIVLADFCRDIALLVLTGKIDGCSRLGARLGEAARSVARSGSLLRQKRPTLDVKGTVPGFIVLESGYEFLGDLGWKAIFIVNNMRSNSRDREPWRTQVRYPCERSLML
jgi:hypothetical protein